MHIELYFRNNRLAVAHQPDLLDIVQMAFAEVREDGTGAGEAQLLDLLKGLKMALTFENAMLKTPAVQELVAELNEEHKRNLAEKDRVIAEKDRAMAETTRQHILRVLTNRFGTFSEDVTTQLQTVHDQQQLNSLHDVALNCGNVDAFRAAIVKP